MAFTAYDNSSGLALLGRGIDSLNANVTAYDKQNALKTLGGQIQSGDLDGAIATAFANGDLATGQALTAQKQQKAALDSANSLISPLLGGGSSPTTPQASSASAAPRAMRMPADPEIENRFIGTLKQGGLTNPNALAAVAAYANAESGYSPQNINGSWSDPSQSGQPGTSGGILSWRGPRLAAMRQQTAGAPDPVVAQAKFLLTENPDLTVALQNAKTPEEANALMANAWKFAGYDQPGGESARRLAMTQSYLPRVAGQPQQQVAQAAPVAPAQPPQGMNPAAAPPPTSVPSVGQGVRTASADPNFAPQMPAGGAPPVAPAQTAPAAADPLVVVPGINGGRPINKAWVAAQPDGADVPDDDVLERAQAGGTAPAGPPPAAISAAAPQVLQQAGAPAAVTQAVASTTDPTKRAQILMRASLIPGLPDSYQKLIGTLLTNELKQSEMPDTVKQFMFAQTPAGGSFKGTLAEWAGKEKDDATVAQKKLDYARANWKANNLPDPNSTDPAAQTYWRDLSTKVLGGSGGVQVINNAAKVQSAAEAKLSDAKLGDVTDAITASKPARDRLQTLSILQDAWKNSKDGIQTGPLGEGALKLKQLANGFGIPVNGLTETELVQKVGTQLAAEASKDLTSRPTQFDFQVFLANNPGINLSKDGNLSLISLMQQQARQKIALAALARKQENGDNWDEVAAKFDREHPLISPLTHKPIDPNDILYPDPNAPKPAPRSAPAPGSLTQTEAAESIANAKAAVAKNPAARDEIVKRLTAAGVDASGL